MPIDVFSRLASGPLDDAEEIVLRRVVSILEARSEDAVVVVNMLLDRHEVDLVVATETATLVIEVKGYKQAIEGSKNDRKWRMAATGKELDKNFYAQVHSASLELKDTLRKEVGRDPGYARAVLLFAYGIPVGSMLPRTDHRVTTVGIEALEDILREPIPAGSKRRVWSPDLIRWFACKNGLAQMKAPAAECVSIDEVEYVEVQSKAAYPSRSGHTMPQVIELHVASVVQPATFSRPSPRRARRRSMIVALIALPVLAGGALNWLHPVSNVPLKTASMPRHAYESHHRHAMTDATRQARIARAAAERDESSALLEAQQANLQVQAARLSQPAPPPASPPPCPPGIDRLGCVPDPQTLAKLRRY